MPKEADAKKYAGNVLHYQFLDRCRQPTFLRRNLVQSLARHREAAEASCHVDSGCARRERWCFPKRETLDVLARERKPAVQVTIWGLAPPGGFELFDTSGRPDKPDTKRTNLFTAPCRIDAGFYDAETNTQRRQALHHESRQSTLQAYSRSDGSVVFDCIMHDPLVVEAAKLFVNGRAISKTCNLKIEVSLYDEQDVALIAPIISGGRHQMESSLLKLSAESAILWDRPQLRLPMKMVIGDTEYKTNYILSLIMGWDIAEETSMQTYNRILRKCGALEQSARVAESLPVDRKTHVTYNFDQLSRYIKLNDCLCLFCNRRDYGTPEILHLHLLASHQLFLFTFARKPTKVGADEQIKIEVRLPNCRSKSEVAISNILEDPRARKTYKVAWVAPKRPFDISQYLQGDDSWTAGPVGRHVTATKDTKMTKITRKIPREVPDLDRRQQRKYRIPAAPQGLRFFRLATKREIEEGEALSESDNEIDEDWLKQQHSRDTRDTPANAFAKEFLMTWDNFFLDERIVGDVHAGDALIRFARKYSDRLINSPRLGAEFYKKATELHEDGIISDSVYGACKRLIEYGHADIKACPRRIRERARERERKNKKRYLEDSSSEEDSDLGEGDDVGPDDAKGGLTRAVAPLNRTRDSDGDEEMTDANGAIPDAGGNGEDSEAFRNGCICGKVVENDMEAIMCADLVGSSLHWTVQYRNFILLASASTSESPAGGADDASREKNEKAAFPRRVRVRS